MRKDGLRVSSSAQRGVSYQGHDARPLVLMRTETPDAGTGGSPGFHTRQMNRPACTYFGFEFLERQREGLDWRKGDMLRVEVRARNRDVKVNAIGRRCFRAPFDHHFSVIDLYPL